MIKDINAVNLTRKGLSIIMRSRALRGQNLIAFIASIVLSISIILISMRIWEVDLSIPTGFSGDGTLLGLLVKSISENGIRGFWFNSRIGAPEVSTLVDTPFMHLGMQLEFYVLTRFFSNPYTCIYIQYILGYAFCTGSMYLLLNRYSDSKLIKIILSVLFAVTPYHFIRGMGHQTLSSYYEIPLFIYLMDIIYIENFQGVVPTRYKDHKWKIGILYLSCFIVGISNIYYAFAGLLCMMMALIGRIIRRKKAIEVLPGVVLVFSVLFGVLVGLLPKVFYSIRNGWNLSAGIRQPLEAEVYGLKVIQLVLPCNYNRVGFLAELNNMYTARGFNINENAFSSLGLFGTIGFLMACEWVIWRIVQNNKNKTELTERSTITSLAILMLVLYATAGGFGTLFNYIVTPELRAYNRFSIVICALSMCMVCFFYDYIIEKSEIKWKRVCCGCVASSLFLFSLYSEVPNYVNGWQKAYIEKDSILQDFFNDIENTMEPDSMVYQLPYLAFPESWPINNMMDYQPALGYIYTNNIKWSYGGMRGRNKVAENLNKDNGISYEFVNGIKKAGYSGVLIDTTGFEDNGARINSFYSEKLKLKPIISGDEQFYFYDIRNLEIDARSLVAGYGFVERFAQLTGVNIDEESTAIYAERIQKSDSETIDLMWDWLSNCSITETQMNNRDYIRFLYSNIIGRDEEHPEGWSSQLDAGLLTRKDAFKIFITCDEFKNRNGFV